ncbi:BTB/POZ and MATH domain-containing protein 2-like [Triticum dicoccoides]|uniref:BTB/POZ and MATH domain-containing protein 2-like n=1 Tax=Triticum dicoccoides TaxID=85692 RepID=UPI00189174D6|nr:BTB/POZ and MATH domain-containing protein 2-like [Triticum dicoccoides]
MSMGAVLSAVRAAGRQQLSASIVAARQVSASHVLRIDGYSRISKILATGQATRSGTFSVGGHDWHILHYPNGCFEQHKGSLSFFLEHASHAKTGDTTAKVELSILDHASKPSHTQTKADYRFSNATSLNWGWRDFIKHEDLDVEKHLKDDCLTILCDVTVTVLDTEDHSEAAAPEPTVVEPPFGMRGQLAEFIWNKKEVDVHIEVGGETLPAHRRILEAASPVFKAHLSLASATTGRGGGCNSNTALLRVDDMDAEVFKALLQFIYLDSPPRPLEKTMAERLLVAADRYELEKLKLICEAALLQHVDLSSVAAALALAERHHCSVLRTACVQFLSSPGNLEAFMASGDFAQLKTGCPSALLPVGAPREEDDASRERHVYHAQDIPCM